MDGRTDGRTDGWVDGWTDGRMDGATGGVGLTAWPLLLHRSRPSASVIGQLRLEFNMPLSVYGESMKVGSAMLSSGTRTQHGIDCP